MTAPGCQLSTCTVQNSKMARVVSAIIDRLDISEIEAGTG